MKTKIYVLVVALLSVVMVFAQPLGSGKSGKFSVAAGVQVRFSQGNLQFNVSQGTHLTADGNQPGTFRFAENQYDTIGATNKNITIENYTGWISLFGWGTSGYNGCSPMTYLTDATYGDGTTADIAGTNYDWGVYNAISNGGNQPGMWRTLTRAEWAYLLTNRANAEQLYSMAKINGIGGLIILPDGWTQPSGITFTPKMNIGQTTNIYTLEQWQTLENAGAIFFPKEGYRNYSESDLKVTYSTGNNYYATSTNKSRTMRYVMSTGTSSYYNGDTYHRTGVPVRLARTVEEYTVVFKDWDGKVLKTENIEYGFAANPPANPTREGYTFVSWQANVSGMQTNYITSEVTFTAQYEKYVTYTVTFVDGLTGDVISTLVKAKGATLATSEYPAVPTHEGNAFQGWFLPNGTAPISTTLTVNGNLTLTARFTWDAEAGVLKAPMNEGHNKFSISADRQVVFSQGNLQYQPSTGKWQFAAEQETRLTQAENKKLTDASYTGWIDVFTWSNDEAVYGLTTSAAYPSSTGAFVDWGQNPIANGGNKADNWRTLSNDEWTYLLSGRTNAAELTFMANLSDGSYGIVILPDGWKDNVVCNSLLTDIDYCANNTIDADDWNTFEAYGALFLPWGPYSARYSGSDSWGNAVNYWSKTYNDEMSGMFGSPWAYMVNEGSGYRPQTAPTSCSSRLPVRLARYVQECPEISSEFSAEAIGCYTWGGKTYVTSGDYRRIYSNVDGCDSIVTLHLTITQEQPVGGSGVLEGLFSVSADTQVRFSKGDLQYQESTHTWRFAPEQVDAIGSAAISDGWEDLFGWSSDNSQFGLGTDFTGDFVDWGENAIANGGNRQNRWRTLTKAEWEYLRNGRANAAQRKYSGKIEGRSGTILLPDDWTAPAGVTLASGDNELTRAQWKILEQAGAVFLPFNGLSIWYWSATASSESGAYDMYGDALGRDNKEPVRLVQEPAKPIGGTLTGKFSVSADKQVRFSQGNLQYQASTDTWQFAASQTEYIGEDNANVSPTYDGWIDMYGWGTGNNPTTVDINARSQDYATFVDWGTNTISNGGNQANVWRTLSNEEWYYLKSRRPNAAQLYGPATVNNVYGLILLPDDWESPVGITFTPNPDPYFPSLTYEANVYSSTQWTKMVENGAVFLPAEGYGRRNSDGSTTIYNVQHGEYWTSTSDDGQNPDFRGYAYAWRFTCIEDYKSISSVFQGRSCVSSVRLVRDFVPGEDCVPVYTSFSETVCDDYTWNGVRYTVSGDYEQTFTTANGCDSIVTLHLTVHPSYNIGFGEEAVGSYTWQGTTYTESGDYTKTFQTVNGCDSVVTLHLTIGETPQPQKWTNGVLPGKFSVSANKQVNFSQGNLQYKASDNIWQFAENQNDYVGNGNAMIAEDYDDWIDLFGWGTGNNPTLASTDDADYATFTDWGINPISNGGNTANMWSTLTGEEWNYLFYGRANAATLFALGSVNRVNGVILLPDNWTLPDGASFTASITLGLVDEGDSYLDEGNGHFDDNRYTAAQWEVMENAGAVFLPAAGVRQGAYVGTGYGRYSSSTLAQTTYANQLYFYSSQLKPKALSSVNRGNSVRLVKEAVQSSATALDETATNASATKRLVNGQLLIEKNGCTYNAQGIRIK